MNTKTAKIVAIASILVMLFSATAFVAYSDADDGKTITVTDGLGNTHVFDSSPAHVIAIGKGFTEMICQIDALDKLVVTDNSPYSSTDGIAIFNDYKGYCIDGYIKHAGSIYSASSWMALRNEIIEATENGKFDKDNDVIFLTGGFTYSDPVYEELSGLGYRHVLRWETISNYQDIITAAEAVSTVVIGEIHEKVKHMREKATEIYAKFNQNPSWTDKKAFYVTYSGGQFKVGDYGSIATAVLIAAHLDVVTVGHGEESTYAPEGGITSIVEKCKEEGYEVVIFADQDTIMKNETNYSKLVHESGGSRIYQMNSLWNNYSIDSMNGYWTIACTMYKDYDPDFFSGSVADSTTKQDGNIWAYLLAGIVVAIVLMGITYWVSRE